MAQGTDIIAAVMRACGETPNEMYPNNTDPM
jgi:hypothetical protein